MTSLWFIPGTLPLGLQRQSFTLASYFHCFRPIACVELFLRKPIHLHEILLYVAQGNLLDSVSAKFISTHHLSINAAYKAREPNWLVDQAIGCDLRQETADRIWSSSLPPIVIKSAGNVQFKHQETGNGKTRIWWGQGCHVDADHTPHAVWSANCSSGRDVWFTSLSSVCTQLVYPLINVYIWCSLWYYVSGWFAEYLVPSLEIQKL